MTKTEGLSKRLPTKSFELLKEDYFFFL